jgi:hypothetical protein
METAGRRIEPPEVSADYKYRRIYLAFLKSLETMMPVIVKHEGVEGAKKVYFAATGNFARALGHKIVKDYALAPDLEGALRLLEVYNRIFGSEKLYSTLDHDAAYHVIEDCTLWEKMFKPTKTRCDESCTHSEIPHLLKTLGPGFQVEMPESRPAGNECCVFKITALRPGGTEGE